MTSELGEQRHSRAADAELITDPILKAEAEAQNGLRQYDLGLQIIHEAIDRGPAYKLRLSKILALQREALNGISSYAGNFRPASVAIEGSKHEPPGAHLVPELVEGLCDYINENWDKTALHLAAYAMWRLNWIHPFSDGNGRTSRILSYIILCARVGAVLPGVPTIPDQIVDNRKPYFDALDAADDAWAEGRLDISKMESLLESLLARQLTSAFAQAGGRVDPTAGQPEPSSGTN
ncbi:Fic family protein [Xanthobacter sp. YC-JY1]|uniref:Fic family protein n=1 Tax=Xanthobacter sp. YC-JY1 TaxID=2419844 RepID=UPI001F1EA354|nr:Fic family protein [Xanthobacter sp. YC-JY1]UJX45458.1 Fic family protein [Xanthobacter sp. YC-JY1]